MRPIPSLCHCPLPLWRQVKVQKQETRGNTRKQKGPQPAHTHLRKVVKQTLERGATANAGVAHTDGFTCTPYNHACTACGSILSKDDHHAHAPTHTPHNALTWRRCARHLTHRHTHTYRRPHYFARMHRCAAAIAVSEPHPHTTRHHHHCKNVQESSPVTLNAAFFGEAARQLGNPACSDHTRRSDMQASQKLNQQSRGDKAAASRRWRLAMEWQPLPCVKEVEMHTPQQQFAPK